MKTRAQKSMKKLILSFLQKKNKSSKIYLNELLG